MPCPAEPDELKLYELKNPCFTIERNPEQAVLVRVDDAEPVPCIDPPGALQDRVGPECETFIPDRASEGDAAGNQRIANTAALEHWLNMS
jgi:hypothetical protein